MEEAHRDDETRERAVERLLVETVAARGKQHNPVTGSGGMLTGTGGEGRRVVDERAGGAASASPC